MASNRHLYRKIRAGLLGVLLSTGGGVACHPSSASSPPADSATAHQQERAALWGGGVATIESENHPPLQLVYREGDPELGLAISIATGRGSLGTLALQALVETRLPEMADERAQSRLLGSLTLRFGAARGAQVSAILRRFQAALSASVGPEDPALARFQERLAQLQATPAEHSPRERCLLTLGSDSLEIDPKLPDHEFLEGVRSESMVSRRVSIAAVGPRSELDSVREWLTDPWPQGEPLTDNLALSPLTVLSSPSRELTLLVLTSDRLAALQVFRAFRNPSEDMEARLLALPHGAELLTPRIQFRRSSACVAVTLGLGPSTSPRSETMERAASTLMAAAHHAMERPVAGDPTAFLLVPESAKDAAELAARTHATHAQGAGIDLAWQWSGPATREKPQLPLSPEKRERSSLPLQVVSQPEFGQRKLYAFLASTCGIGSEPRKDSGLWALMLSSVATAYTGRDDVELIPYLGAQGFGLLASSIPREGESPSAHSRRVGDALGRALAGIALPGPQVASTRADLIQALDDHPVEQKLRDVFAFDTPSAISPTGLPEKLAELGNADVERARITFLELPLELVVLPNQSAEQTSEIAHRLADWVLPRQEQKLTCAAHAPTPIHPGLYRLESSDPELDPRTDLAVAVPLSRSVGLALSQVLLSEPAFLSRLGKIETQGAVQVRFLGHRESGVLAFTFRETEAKGFPLETKLREALRELGQSGLSPNAQAQMSQLLAEDHMATRSTQRGRAILGFLGEAPRGARPSDSAGASELVRKHFGEPHHVVIRLTRR